MPLLIWLSACSYWQRVNAEMTRATLQFLDCVERQQSSQNKAPGSWRNEQAGSSAHEDVRARSRERPESIEPGSLTGVDPARTLERQKDMDKDRLEGSAKQAKGAIKEVAGKVTGDAKLEAEGKSDKAAGKVQNAVGGLKDTLRGK